MRKYEKLVKVNNRGVGRAAPQGTLETEEQGKEHGANEPDHTDDYKQGRWKPWH